MRRAVLFIGLTSLAAMAMVGYMRYRRRREV